MTMSTGLWLFIAVYAATGVGLLVDLVLSLLKWQTISATVWQYPVLGALILLVELAGMIGLATHFIDGPL